MKASKNDDFFGETDEICGDYTVEQRKDEKITPNRIVNMLDNLYQKSTDGIMNKSVEEVAEEYLSKKGDVQSAAKAMLNMQTLKCTTFGLAAGAGGMITLPITMSVDTVGVLYTQIRMIQCVAYMGGYDIRDDRVVTFIYACLAGISVGTCLKDFGVKLGRKLTHAAIKKIPDKVITKINEKVGFKFITKFGSKGLVRLGKLVPVAGMIIGGGIDLVETKIIANRAYKMFIEDDLSICGNKEITEC